MRSQIADFEVLEPMAATPDGRARYLCRAPERMAPAERVMVTEVAVDASGWTSLVEKLSRWMAVRSPDLLQLIEAGPDLDPAAAGVYLASEFPSGGRLADAAEGTGLAGRVQALAAVARGVHTLHEAGLAHGSIDLDSIFLTDHGAVLAPPSMDRPAGLVARAGDWRSFVAIDPELLAGEPPGRSSDIWSLGATVHVVVSDRPLYPGIDEDEPVTAVQRVLFTRPDVDPELDPALADTVAACLSADPGARPGTAMQVAERLAAAEAAL